MVHRPWCFPDDAVAKSSPVFWEWCTTRSWNEIDPREPPRISIQPSDMGWKVSVSFYELARRYDAIVHHWQDIPAVLDYLFQDGNYVPAELKTGSGAQKIRDERKKKRDIRDRERYHPPQGGGDQESE